jgi:hypothetical protein
MRKSTPKSRRKKAPKRALALPDLEQSKAAVLSSLTSVSGQRTYDCDSRVCRLVLLGAASCVQPHRRAPRPDSPRATPLRSSHDQPATRRRAPGGLRGGRCWAAQSRAGGRHSAREGRATSRGSARKLARPSRDADC